MSLSREYASVAAVKTLVSCGLSQYLRTMIIKVKANGKLMLHPDLAGCVFNVQEQRDAATRVLLHKLGQQQKAASLSESLA
jgi:hypothetical protein